MANLDFIGSLLGALTKKKKAPSNVDVYPNGVPRQPMDERLPSGESMYDLTRRMMSQPQTPDTPSAPYQQYQNLTLPPIGDAPAIDPRYVGDDSAMTAPAAPAVPASAILSPRAQLESQIADVQGRRYNKGVYRDDAGNLTSNPKLAVGEPVIAPGKDRDKKWSLVEKVAGALEGWLTGGIVGGVKGATDRNFFEKQHDQNELGRLVPALARQQEIDKYNTQEQTQNTANQNVVDDNARQYQDLMRKQEKDRATTEYWNRKADQGDLRLANEDKLIELRDKWAASKDKNDQKRLALVEKEMENRNKRSDLDRSSREKVAGMKETGARTRLQITLEAQREAAAVRAAEARALKATDIDARKQAQAEAQAARERLARLKAEYGQ